jgi:hypothetical protein
MTQLNPKKTTIHGRAGKGGEIMQRILSKLLMVLALGAILAMPSIMACKKSSPGGTTTRQIYPGPGYADPGGHAPIPGTLLLVGSGLAGLGLLRWKKGSKP